MAALDGLGFANYAIGMGEKGRDFVFQQAERVRAQLERERLQAEQLAARERNARIFGTLGGAQPPQMGLGQSPQTPQMGGTGLSVPGQPGQPMAQAQPGRGGKNPYGQLFAEQERLVGLPAGYLTRTAQLESGDKNNPYGNPNAQNAHSSAGGLFQFIDRTARAMGLSNRFDPVEATKKAALLGAENYGILKRSLGREPSGAELYLSHQQGPNVAIRLLRDPNAPLGKVMGREEMRLNGGNPNMTAGQFAARWLNTYNSQPYQNDEMASPGPGQVPQAPQPQQQAQLPQAAPQGQMPGANIPTAQLIAIMRDPGSSEEDKAIAKMLLEPRFADPMARRLQEAQISKTEAEAEALGKPKPSDLPGDVREYQYAKSQGYTGSFEQWKLATRAGGTSVTVGGDKPYEKAIGEAVGKMVVSWMEEGNNARQQMLDIGILRGALKNSPTGMAGGLASIAQSYGLDVTGMGDVQIAESVVNKLVPAQRPPGSGTMSDADVLLFKASLPSLWGTPQGNTIILNSMQALAEYKMALAAIGTKAAMGQITREQAFAEAAAMPNPLAYFRAMGEQQKRGSVPPSPASPAFAAPGQQTVRPPATNAAPQPGTISKGYQFIGGDPSQPSSWRKVQ